MSVAKMQRTRPFPNFKLDILPQEERFAAGLIRLNIADLHERAINYWAAKTLFEHCAFWTDHDHRSHRIWQPWQLIAARDCVMSIYHFGRIIEGIDHSLGICPELRNIINGGAKRAARKEFERSFPFYISFRNALAHSAERSHTPKDFKIHGKVKDRPIYVNSEIQVTVDESAILLLMDNVQGTTFSSMWAGDILRCEITDATGAVLDNIIDEFWSAFAPILTDEREPAPTITSSEHPFDSHKI